MTATVKLHTVSTARPGRRVSERSASTAGSGRYAGPLTVTSRELMTVRYAVALARMSGPVCSAA